MVGDGDDDGVGEGVGDGAKFTWKTIKMSSSAEYVYCDTVFMSARTASEESFR